MIMRMLALVNCCLLAACGEGPLTQDRDGTYQVAGKSSPEQLTSAVLAFTDATLVVAFGPSPHDAVTAVVAAERTTQPFVVTIAAMPTGNAKMADAVIVAETGATAAIDLALLASNGIKLQPHRLEVGCRTFTPANRAAGGLARPGPGDAILALMRMQHATLLTTHPDVDNIHHIGLILTIADDVWQARVAKDVTAAATRYPQVHLTTKDAQAAADPAAATAQLIANGCRALIVSTSDPSKTKAIIAAASQAPDGAVPVIVLDPLLDDGHGTCRIGCPPATLGKAAAIQVKLLLPEGGAMIACLPDTAPANAGPDLSQPRVRGFCSAMGFDADRLLAR